MRKIALALAAFGIAALFTACESSEANVVSCDTKSTVFGYTTHVCAETDENSVDAAELQDKCKSTSVEGLADVRAAIGSGCPNGSLMKCTDGATSRYFYDEGANNKTCQQLMQDVK